MNDNTHSQTDHLEFFKIIGPLLSDVGKCEKELDKFKRHKSIIQFWRRQYCHSVYTCIEGYISMLKRTVLYMHERQSYNCSIPEISLLSEKSYDLKDNGKLKTRPTLIPLIQNLRFSFDIFAKCFNSKYRLDLGSDQSWDIFKRFIKIRHRITHPKDIADLNISDDDLSSTKTSREWFTKIVTELIESSLSEDLRKAAIQLKESYML